MADAEPMFRNWANDTEVVRYYDTRNIASRKVMQKAGMLYEGTFRQCKVRRGELVSKSQYAILAEGYFDSDKGETVYEP